MSNDDPYLSIVAASRNDNHGGELLPRMQLFIDGLATQCDKFELPAELILVEWNPPDDQPRLTEAIRWPSPERSLSCRVITVPPSVHHQFEGSERIALFQMIAKNVGVRRADGAFILATNIDILFSDELMEFIAQQTLEPGVLYRTDRMDSQIDMEPWLNHQDRLRQCEENIIRINQRSGIFDIPTKTISFGARLGHLKARLWAIARLATRPRRNRLALTEHSLLLLSDLGVPEFYRNWYQAVYGPILHLNAAGDFTLLARDDWKRLCGYAELPTHGLFIDALLCTNAYALGIREEFLSYQIFHIEHEGTWSREKIGAETNPVQTSLKKKPLITTDDFRGWQREIQVTKMPKFQNPEWGFLNDEFMEFSGADLNQTETILTR